MIQTGIATFRIRTFGRFRLSGDSLEYLGKVEDTDLEDLFTPEVLGSIFESLDVSFHTTVHGASQLLPRAFAVGDEAVTELTITNTKTPKDIGDLDE